MRGAFQDLIVLLTYSLPAEETQSEIVASPEDFQVKHPLQVVTALGLAFPFPRIAPFQSKLLCTSCTFEPPLLRAGRRRFSPSC